MATAAEKSPEVITPEHAVLIPPVPAANSMMAYVEAVATVIGSCHIHSVYEDREHVKIYLNDKKFVDFLVNTGISILGRRVNVDYAIPRADKITLTSVDPILPDSILMRFLCFYGTPVSTIIHEKIATNLEYSHIECGTRKIYMNLFNDKKPPTKVSIQHQEVCYRFEMSVERYDKRVLEIDSSTTEEANDDDNMDDAQEVESVQSLKPNIEELALHKDVSRKSRGVKSATPAQAAYRSRGRPAGITYAARKLKSRAAKGWYKNKVKKAKDITSNREVVSKKAPAGKTGRRGGRGGFSRGGRGGSTKSGRGRSSKGSVVSSPVIQDPDINLVNGDEDMEQNSSSVHEDSPGDVTLIEKATSQNISQYPLSTEELKKLLFQTRFHRSPHQVAQEFLARKNAADAVDDLLTQLMEYHNAVKVQSLRIRIRRLVKTLEAIKDNKAEE